MTFQPRNATRAVFGPIEIAITLAWSTAIIAAGLATAFPQSFNFAVPVPIVIAVPMVIGVLLREWSISGQRAGDKTKHVNDLRKLKKKNRWLNLTENSAKVGHWRLDLITDEVFWSQGTFAIHASKQTSPPELKDAIDYFHPDDRQIVIDNIEQARASGQSYSFRARLISEDGKTLHTAAEARVERNEHGEPVALFGVIQDRTAEEEMLGELRNARDEARQLAQSKGLFLARMSHEIRTPMNGVLGFAELLGRSHLNPEQQRHTDLIIESGKSLQTLLNDILDLTKIEAGHVEINPGPVDILHLLYRVTQLAEPAAREKNIRLVYDTSPDFPRHIIIDALRLRQILSNLLSNAVRFTDNGGVSLAASCVQGKLRFAVCDTGTGISPQMRDQIFDPFTQESRHATGSRGGTGLGLAISRQLAELMDGSLSVRSEPGEGSVFTLTLPLTGADAPEKPNTTKAPQGNYRQNTARILLAEDYDINRELITEMARQIGVAIECAEDGVEAVAMVNHARAIGEPYALVLMDLQMPRLDGLEASRDIRMAGISPDELPIIALTANAFADDVQNCLSAGMQEHLAKPLSIDRLHNAINRWVTADGPNPPLPNIRQRAA